MFKVQSYVEMCCTKQILTYDIVNYVTDKAEIWSNFGYMIIFFQPCQQLLDCAVMYYSSAAAMIMNYLHLHNESTPHAVLMMAD